MRLAVIGTGLIGASVGLAAKRTGATVSGFDEDEATAEVALERGAVDEVKPTLADALGGADLAVVAVPVGRLAAQVRTVLEASAEDCTVTDVGSTKSAVCEAAAGSTRFIGGHPVCGSEARGPAHATADLFEGATWFLSPLPHSDPTRYRLVHGFVGDLAPCRSQSIPARTTGWSR